jgi:hypothetical protein
MIVPAALHRRTRAEATPASTALVNLATERATIVLDPNVVSLPHCRMVRGQDTG